MNFRWWLGPLLAILVWMLGTTPTFLMGGVMAWVVSWWIFQPVPLAVTGLLGVVLSSLLGIVDANTAFSGFSHKVTILLLGTFTVAQGMKFHKLDRSLCEWVLSFPFVKSSPRSSAVAIAILSGILSWWFSSTATLAMLAPIVASLFTGAGLGRVLLAVAYAAPLGGIAFPLGANPNILAIGQLDQQLGIKISFLQWMGPGFLKHIFNWAHAPFFDSQNRLEIYIRTKRIFRL